MSKDTKKITWQYYLAASGKFSVGEIVTLCQTLLWGSDAELWGMCASPFLSYQFISLINSFSRLKLSSWRLRSLQEQNLLILALCLSPSNQISGRKTNNSRFFCLDPLTFSAPATQDLESAM